MVKRFASILGAVAFVFGVFSGCTDSPTSTNNDSFDKAGTVASTSITDQMVNDMLYGDPTDPPPPPRMPPGGDTNRPPMPPPPRGGDTMRPPLPPPTGGDMRAKPFDRILRALRLTDAQKEAVKVCLDDFQACAKANMDTYRDARKELMDEFRTTAQGIRAALQAGTITTEEARTQMRAAMVALREAMKPIDEAMRAGMQSCHTALDECIHPILTPEQWALWQRLVRGPVRRP